MEDVLSKVSYNWTEVITYIWFLTDKFEEKLINQSILKWSPLPLFPACQVVDFLEYLDCGDKACSPIEIIFDVAKIENLGITISLQEKNKVNHRTLKSTALSYDGPRIANKNLMEPRLLRSIVRFDQIIYSERDKKKKCQNYPNTKYKSYDDCDRSYIRHKLESELNLVPFWLTKDFEEVTADIR